MASCVAAATKGGAAQALSTRICTCAADKVAERYPGAAKINIRQEQILPLVAECRATLVPQDGVDSAAPRP